MSRPFADIPGFKKLDAAIRDTISAHLATLRELDKSRAGKRTDDELNVLILVERHLETALKEAQAARKALWDGVV
ncbi:MAG TPA: hypothetical protein PKE29_18005 [Phycisphaerales bacterium]|nr:hypothetical protein [Phycisphaerales bacterium]